VSTVPDAAPDVGAAGRDAGPASGRRARYEALFGTVYEPLQRYVRRRGPTDSADDVVAMVLLVLWQRLDDVPAEAEVAWTYGVARRCLANERRGSRRRLALVGRLEASFTPSVPVASDDPDLDLALARLSPDDRELVRLWAWERLTPSEIAAVLGITANAASIRLHRAKARLADHLGSRKIPPASGHTGDGRTEEVP
jgi:RNA polymerase sigma-70 factor (ECF subfamily)